MRHRNAILAAFSVTRVLRPHPLDESPKKRSLSAKRAIGSNQELSVLLFLVFVMLAFWVMEFVIFHVAAGGLIHLLLIAGIIALIVHLVRRGAA